MNLTNEERETVISFDETPADAVIFTYSHKWKTHLEKKLGLKAVWDNGHGGKEYKIPKKRIPMPRAPRNLSKEQRQKLAERLREARHQKSPNSLGNNTAIRKSQGEKVSKGKVINRQKKGLKSL